MGAFPWLVFVAILAEAPPEAGVPLTVGGRRPDSAIVAVGESFDAAADLQTAMGRLAAGALATYDRSSIGTLLACRASGRAAAELPGERVAVIHLRSDAASEPSRLVEILLLADGSHVVRALDDPTSAVPLDEGRLERLAAGWPEYRGGFDAPSLAAGVSVQLPRPYVGGVAMTARTMKERLYRDIPVKLEDAHRDLAAESMHVRLPAGYGPRTPAGLLVWCSPSPEGQVPGVLGAALDALGIVAVGCDGAGNDRGVPEKLQLAFDSIATARRRFHVDERRVYVAGMSGGGKLASILTVCFPEVFAGAVAVVGFASCHDLDASFGEHTSRYYAMPRGERLRMARSRRIALVSGPRDFNEREMQERMRLLAADGFGELRFFDVPGLGHEMPSAALFAEALAWIDEPRRRAAEDEAASAAALLEDAGTDAAKLRHVLDACPWTPAAWEALARLARR